MPRPRLIFVTASGQQALDLAAVSTLGRDPRSSIQLLDKLVAKEHCVLERREGFFVVRDLGSLGGTYVNGARVDGERPLAHGDEIGFGATRARFDDGAGPLKYALPSISPGTVPKTDLSGGSGGGGTGGSGGPQSPPAAVVAVEESRGRAPSKPS